MQGRSAEPLNNAYRFKRPLARLALDPQRHSPRNA